MDGTRVTRDGDSRARRTETSGDPGRHPGGSAALAHRGPFGPSVALAGGLPAEPRDRAAVGIPWQRRSSDGCGDALGAYSPVGWAAAGFRLRACSLDHDEANGS